VLKHRRYVSIDGWEGALTVKEGMMANGAEGRTRVGHWIKDAREREFW